MISTFIEELNNNNFTAYITGGHCYRKYFDTNEETCDYDIHIYITYKQLNDKENFRKIYNCIKGLYKNLDKKYELLPLTKFDYADYSKKYIENNLLNKQIKFYLHSIIADIQIEDFDNTYVKLFITNKTDEDMYNNLVEKIYNTINVHELQIIEDPIDVASTVRSDILDQGEDTQTFLNNYIDQADTGELDKQKLKVFARELYGEASE